jgi:hypothetical protein
VPERADPTELHAARLVCEGLGGHWFPPKRKASKLDFETAFETDTRVSYGQAWREIHKHGAWDFEAFVWLQSQVSSDGYVSARAVLEWLGY